MEYKNDIDFLISENNKLPSDPPPKLVSEYIEGRRVMPPGTPFPGAWENWRTQYAVEPMDNMSPYSPIKHTDIMSAAQVMKSSIIESCMAYGIDSFPSPILYISGTESLLDKWASKRLEPLINSCGFRDKFHSYNEGKNSKASGDTAKQKLFTGGFLEMGSAQSPSSLRADSIKNLFLEETDAAPEELTTGEGSFDKVAEARTTAFDNTKKIMAVSTPTTFEKSLIFKRFNLGDQRKYLIPCPLCGKYQVLERGELTGSHGLRPDTKAGVLERVGYICDYCHDTFFEYSKNEFIQKGRWEPSAVGAPLRRSYHINSLYSALGMFSWMSYWNEYEEALETPDGMRTFTMLRDGWPYKETGSRPKHEKVIELRGDYSQGTVPDEVLYIVIGADVQQGNINNDDYPERVELEVLGIGAGYRTFSIDYKIFNGKVNNAFAGAWEKINEWAESGGLEFKKKSGFRMSPSIIFIDSGFEQEAVFAFTQRWANTYPCKGFKNVGTKDKNKDKDKAGPNTIKRYKPFKSGGGGIIVYEVATNWYKHRTYTSLAIEPQNTKIQKPGFASFPATYPERYFKQLTAEEKLSNGDFHKPSHRRNETLDCRVYGLCAADVYLDALVLEHKAVAKANKATPDEILKINHRMVIDILVAENQNTLIVQ